MVSKGKGWRNKRGNLRYIRVRYEDRRDGRYGRVRVVKLGA